MFCLGLLKAAGVNTSKTLWCSFTVEQFQYPSPLSPLEIQNYVVKLLLEK